MLLKVLNVFLEKIIHAGRLVSNTFRIFGVILNAR